MLVIGLLGYFAARSTGGGVAGILLSSVIWWGAFQFATPPLRAVWRKRENITLQHITFGGCLTAVSACAGGGLIFLFGPQLLLGLMIGPLAAYWTRQGGIISIMKSLGIDPMRPVIPSRPRMEAARRQCLYLNGQPIRRIRPLAHLTAAQAGTGSRWCSVLPERLDDSFDLPDVSCHRSFPNASL